MCVLFCSFVALLFHTFCIVRAIFNNLAFYVVCIVLCYVWLCMAHNDFLSSKWVIINCCLFSFRCCVYNELRHSTIESQAREMQTKRLSTIFVNWRWHLQMQQQLATPKCVLQCTVLCVCWTFAIQNYSIRLLPFVLSLCSVFFFRLKRTHTHHFYIPLQINYTIFSKSKKWTNNEQTKNFFFQPEKSENKQMKIKHYL